MTIKYLRLITTAALLLAAVVVFGQKEGVGINLSLWNKVATQPKESKKPVLFNLGLISNQHKLHGLGINIFGSNNQTTKGVAISGLYNISDTISGISIAGLAQIIGTKSQGLTLSGLTNIVGEDQLGIIGSGLVNLVGNDIKGLAVAGIINANGDDLYGVSFSGLADFTGSNTYGLSFGGLVNIIGEANNGVAIAGLVTIANQNRGLSLAGLINISEYSKGVQLSPINVSGRVDGLQIGLFNFYDGQGKAFQIGLINMNPNTKVQLLAYGGNRTKLNFALRFKNKHFYNILGVGSPAYLKFKDKFSASLLYRTGTYVSLGKYIDLGADIGFQHINTVKNRDKENGIPHRMYALEGRGNVEINISKRIALIGSVGYGTTRWYNKSKTFKKGMIYEAGLSYTLNK